jgi:hypothetical protein
MTNIEKARVWLVDNNLERAGTGLSAFRPRDVTLTAVLDGANIKEIAAWLHDLEACLQREIDRTGDPQFIARRGIYEGIAAEVVGGNWRNRS